MDQTKDAKSSAMNYVFIGFFAVAIIAAAFGGRMKEVTESSVSAAKDAVTLALSLVGFMALWLGLVRVLEVGGLLKTLAERVRPVMVRLFPDVPANHPAMSAMLLNISANMLGLGNAATPLGIKAMVELNRLNPFPGTATNAMCLFLVINTTSVTILPLGIIGVRAAAGANDPANVFLTTLIATIISTTIGVLIALFFAKRDRSYLVACEEQARVGLALNAAAAQTESTEYQEEDYSKFRFTATPLWGLAAKGFIFALLIAIIYQFYLAPDKGEFILQELLSFWLLPFLMLIIIAYGMAQGVKVYEAVTDGAKQGFEIAVRIIPFLVTILVAVGIFRASGAMEFLIKILTPITGLINLPAEVLPVALLRPLSGSGSFALTSSIINNAPNSYEAFLAGTIQGSTETTFYVLAVYFGAVGVTKIRHALVAGLLGDIAGVLASCAICSWLWQA